MNQPPEVASSKVLVCVYISSRISIVTCCAIIKNCKEFPSVCLPTKLPSVLVSKEHNAVSLLKYSQNENSKRKLCKQMKEFVIPGMPFRLRYEHHTLGRFLVVSDSIKMIQMLWNAIGYQVECFIHADLQLENEKFLLIQKWWVRISSCINT